MPRDSTADGESGAAQTDGGNQSAPSAILSPNHREFLRGEKDDVSNPKQYESNLRYRANNTVEQMAEDLALLEETGHEDIVARFYYRINRVERLRREMGLLGDAPEPEPDG